MAKIVRSDRSKYGVWVKPAASIIYQGVEWDATKIHHKSTSVAIACLASNARTENASAPPARMFSRTVIRVLRQLAHEVLGVLFMLREELKTSLQQALRSGRRGISVFSSAPLTV
jgi:hypothetical protein